MTYVALVTGGNRGIGFETCRQLAGAGLDVILTSRERAPGLAAAQQLARDGIQVRAERLDVSDGDVVTGLAERLKGEGIAVQVLVNNAGILLDGDRELLSSDEDVLMANLEVHFLGALRTCRAFMPGMIERGYGRVVNVVSGWGSIAGGVPGPGGYALAKAATRALTRRLAAEARRGGDVKVNAVDPGWVATRMGGAGAPRTPAIAAHSIVRLCTLPADGPTDACFSDDRQVAW